MRSLCFGRKIRTDRPASWCTTIKFWQCYLMPFVSLQPGQTDPLDVSEYATQRFSLPKEAFAAQEIAGYDLRPNEDL